MYPYYNYIIIGSVVVRGKYLILAILVGITYSAVWYADAGVHEDISGVAASLRSDDPLITAYNIEGWTELSITPVEYFLPRGVEITWLTREGDCTDKAILMTELLRDNGIPATLVHGYVGTERHDWVEAQIHGRTISLNDLGGVKVGSGVW